MKKVSQPLTNMKIKTKKNCSNKTIKNTKILIQINISFHQEF